MRVPVEPSPCPLGSHAALANSSNVRTAATKVGIAGTRVSRPPLGPALGTGDSDVGMPKACHAIEIEGLEERHALLHRVAEEGALDPSGGGPIIRG